jgi:hypothetical protein
MKNSIFKRRITAAFFLMLFSLCVTPKRFLHDLLANHKDTPVNPGGLLSEQISTSGFHCHTEELVVMEPFLPGVTSSDPLMLSSQTLHYCEPLQSFIPSYCCLTDDRGPPALLA